MSANHAWVPHIAIDALLLIDTMVAALMSVAPQLSYLECRAGEPWTLFSRIKGSLTRRCFLILS